MITHSNIMAVLESYPKHNMVAYLEKTDGNAEFHEIIDLLTAVHSHSLTIKSVVFTTFVEHFRRLQSQNNQQVVGHIIPKKAWARPEYLSQSINKKWIFLFDDHSPHSAIIDAIRLWDKQLANVPVPLDHFPVNALTSKVFSFMVKKGKHFSGKVTPLFASMLVQPTEDEGAPSERPSEAQPTPSPAPTSEVPIEPQTDPSPRPSPSTIIPDSIPESSGGNLGGHSSSDKSLSGNEGEMTLQSIYDLCLSLCAHVSD
ncbi:hypothetical protein Tco_0614812 [Tanacetum coccineum]